MYCRTCSLQTCKACLQDNHTGHNVVQLSAVLVEFQHDLNDISKIAAKRITSLQQMTGDLGTAELSIQEHIDEASRDIINSMHSMMEFYERKLKAKVKQAKASARQHIANVKTEMENVMESTSSLKLKADATILPDVATSAILQAPNIKQQLLHQQNLPVPSVLCSVDKKYVKPTGLLYTAGILGNINIRSSTRKDPRLNCTAKSGNFGDLLQTIQIATHYSGDSGVCGIAPIYSTMICIAHFGVAHILVYTNAGEFKKRVRVPGISEMYGMVATDGIGGKLAIVSGMQKVHDVTLSEDLEIQQHPSCKNVISINLDRISMSCNKQVVVNSSSETGIIVMTPECQVSSNVKTAIPSHKFNVNVAQTSSGFVICDIENAKVYFADSKGHILHTSTDCVDPWHAVHTSWRHVLIADYRGNEIKVFGEAGDFLGNLRHDSSNDSTYPHYLHVDEAERRMYIACGSGDTRQVRIHKLVPSDLPPLPLKRSVTNLAVTAELAKVEGDITFIFARYIILHALQLCHAACSLCRIIPQNQGDYVYGKFEHICLAF